MKRFQKKDFNSNLKFKPRYTTKTRGVTTLPP
jgi:hypothetical protein